MGTGALRESACRISHKRTDAANLGLILWVWVRPAFADNVENRCRFREFPPRCLALGSQFIAIGARFAEGGARTTRLRFRLVVWRSMS